MSIIQEIKEKNVRFVTLAGELLEANGYIAGGKANDDEASILGRHTEIVTLNFTLSKLRHRLSDIENRSKHQHKRLKIVLNTLNKIDQELQNQQNEVRENKHGQQNAVSSIERVNIRLGHLQNERSQISERNLNIVNDTKEIRSELTALETQSDDLESQIVISEDQQNKIEFERQRARDEHSNLQVERAGISASNKNLLHDYSRLNDLERKTKESIERQNKERFTAEGNIEVLLEKIEQITDKVQILHEEREELVEVQNDARQEWSELNTRNRALEEEISVMQRGLNTERERRHKIELRISELDSKIKALQQRLQEDHNCNVEVLGIPTEEVDTEALEKHVDNLRQSINRLGSVHLGVLEEYDEQKERYDFLVQQRDDLTVAAEDLRKTLNLIDRTARSMFVETFGNIREKFQETYARFFEGGEADLKLEDGTDPLEANIEISARPRGKQLQSIALLSGGERALTAISLLFAIYLVKPSPFCILDEVDAPLDDSNIGRFVRVLKEFARKTQFIVVTHNKLTMAAADTLHGVTMPEEGISQLVSVRVEDSEEFVEAAG